jgi:hypothetical protein
VNYEEGMLMFFPVSAYPVLWCAAMALVLSGAAVQVAIGAGRSVVCGTFILLWLGVAAGLPTLLCLNLLVSLVATAFGGLDIRWSDVALASAATIAGCVVASALPALPPPALKALTGFALLVIALPRPPVPGILPSIASLRAGIAVASVVTGLLTVWTATPGPITALALARGGRSGVEISRAMQPISVIGYGAALAWSGSLPIGQIGAGTFSGLVVAALLGTGLGFGLRLRIDPARVVLLIRITAAVAAVLLFASVLR